MDATEAVLAYERRHEDRRVLVALNFSGARQELGALPSGARILLSTRLDRTGEIIGRAVKLGPNEGVVVER